MANNNTKIRASSHRGNEIQLSHIQTDSPLLDIDALIKAREAGQGDIVDFILQETQKEADFRRAEIKKTNKFTFIERMIGMLLAFSVGIGGIFGSLYIANSGHSKLAHVVAVLLIGSLAVGFYKRPPQ